MIILFLRGISPHKLEWLGVILIAMGCGFIVMDPNSGRAENPENTSFSSLLPAAVDIISALFGAFYVLMIVKNKKEWPMCLLIFLL